MENWEMALDRWLTTPPDEMESRFVCDRCNEPLYPDDKYYNCDGFFFCEECAREWFEKQAYTVTEEQAYGE